MAPTPFLNLPAEIRNAVYETALEDQLQHDKQDDYLRHTGERTFTLLNTLSRQFTSTFNPPCPTEPALTRACRQIRRETLPMYYGTNKFTLYSYETTFVWSRLQESIKAGRRWLTHVGQEKAKMVRKLWFVFPFMYGSYCYSQEHICKYGGFEHLGIPRSAIRVVDGDEWRAVRNDGEKLTAHNDW